MRGRKLNQPRTRHLWAGEPANTDLRGITKQAEQLKDKYKATGSAWPRRKKK